MSSDLFELTQKQQRAFSRLGKAYSDCEKEGVFFINNYGSLQAVDSSKICGYTDSQIHASEVSILEVGETSNRIKIANEWCDDEHYYKLTEKGLQIYFGNTMEE